MLLALVSSLLLAHGLGSSFDGPGDAAPRVVAAPVARHAHLDCAELEPVPETDDVHELPPSFGALARTVDRAPEACALSCAARQTARRDPATLTSAAPRAPPGRD